MMYALQLFVEKPVKAYLFTAFSTGTAGFHIREVGRHGSRLYVLDGWDRHGPQGPSRKTRF